MQLIDKALKAYHSGGIINLREKVVNYLEIRLNSLIAKTFSSSKQIQVAKEILRREDGSPFGLALLDQLKIYLDSQSSTKSLKMVVPNYLASLYLRILDVWNRENIKVIGYDQLGDIRDVNIVVLHKMMVGKILTILLPNWDVFSLEYENDHFVLLAQTSAPSKLNKKELFTFLTELNRQRDCSEMDLNGLKFYVRPQTMDYNIVEEVDKEYLSWIKTLKTKSKVVIDIGAHIGAFSVQIADYIGKDCVLHCYEPAIDNRDLIEKNVKENNLEKCITSYPEAVSAKAGRLTLFMSSDNTGGHKLGSQGAGSHESMDVDVITLREVFKRINILSTDNTIEILKVDVEGSEHDILYGNSDILKKYVRHLIVEAGGSLNGDGTTMLKFLQDCGFKCEFKGTPELMTIYCSNKELV